MAGIGYFILKRTHLAVIALVDQRVHLPAVEAEQDLGQFAGDAIGQPVHVQQIVKDAEALGLFRQAGVEGEGVQGTEDTSLAAVAQPQRLQTLQ